MSNPFQDQLLKAGLVNKKQVNKVNQEKSRKNKKQRQKNETVVDEVKLKVQQENEDKTRRDRALNQQKEDQAKSKAITSEINQLIADNCIERDDSCDIIYNFEHRKKVNRIYINADMKQKIISGLLGIARIEGRYELVPTTVAEKIKQRNEKRIIIFEKHSPEQTANKEDPYADFQIPDDLTW